MNIRPSISLLVWLLIGSLLLPSGLQADVSTPTGHPLRKAKKADSARGQMQYVLEGRSGKAWKPLAVKYVDRQPKKSSAALRFLKRFRKPSLRTLFEIPNGYDRSELRVIARRSPFPSNFLSGPSRFSRKSSQGSVFAPAYGISGLALRVDAASVAEADTLVEESDIWKVVGHRLFFFNEYRGLQVFDLSDPQGPVRTGTLRLAASGEQFFALDAAGDRLALLARDPTPAQPASAGGAPLVWIPQDQAISVHLVSVTNGVPSLVDSLPMRGRVIDSRLIGGRLYVLCSRYYAADGSFSPSTVLHGFDLTDPAQPVVLDPVVLAAADYNPVLQAFSDTLLVATSGQNYHWAQPDPTAPAGPEIHVLDISAPGGQPALMKSLPTTGVVNDKFKLNLYDGVITAVSATTNWAAGINGRQTWVETFPAEGSETAPLGLLEIEAARGETLHATRFDSDRLYVVTFRNIDPLFVVNLSDPASPAVTGHLEIPGWSTYIELYGDRLISVGVENGQVAVSLFDVSDDSSPALLSRVFLGTGRSWSEANYDEKAVGFFPDQGLLLAPYQTWSGGQWQSAVAAIEVNPQKLTQRSSITHDFVARRAAVSGNQIVSISGQELIVVNASDLDDPELLAQISLSWRVDRVVPFGPSHLIQIEEGSQYFGGPYPMARLAGSTYGGKRPMIRVTRSDDPDALVEELELGEGRIIGAVRKGDRLLISQVVSTPSGTPGILRTWLFDVSAPPRLREIASADSRLPGNDVPLDFSNAQAVWPNPGTLVWHIPASYWWNWYWHDYHSASIAISQPEKLNPTPKTVAILFPIRFTPKGRPTAERPVVIRGATSSSRPSQGRPFASNGFVFTSHDDDIHKIQNSGNRATWQRRSWLRVIDFRKRGSTVVRKRVSIPGQLLGVRDVDAAEAILFTDNTSTANPAGPAVIACAYDGVNAYRLDTWTANGVPITGTASSDAGHFFVANAGETPAVTSLGIDSTSGAFEVAGVLPLPGIRNELHAIEDFLLASSWGNLDAARIAEDGSFESLASFDTPVNLWIQVSRAAIDPSAGIWLPVLDYGVEFLGFEDLPALTALQPHRRARTHRAGRRSG